MEGKDSPKEKKGGILILKKWEGTEFLGARDSTHIRGKMKEGGRKEGDFLKQICFLWADI